LVASISKKAGIRFKNHFQEDIKMRSLLYPLMPLMALLIVIAGCDRKLINIDSKQPALPGNLADPAPPPEPIVTVDAGGSSLEFWPWMGSDFSGTPSDPVSLIFIGQVDPRALRAALMFLDGDRTAFGFPDDFPFNSTWRDAMGDVQVTYGLLDGWVGNVVQLECGAYDPIRFHLRLIDMGGWTLGGAHFEIIIPGTTEHQVISWELAEQLVKVDFLRSGLLDPDIPFFTTDQINDSPWREIPPYIYNELPLELRVAIGGPIDDVTESVPIGNDGCATVFNVAQDFGWEAEIARQSLTIDFNQVVPKPFCGEETFQYIYVQGPVDLNQVVQVLPNGNFKSRFRAHGHLNITPVDPSTDPPTPLGETYRAVVHENHRGIITDAQTLISSFILQIEIPPSGPFRGRLLSSLHIGPNGHNSHITEVECGG